MFSIESPHVFRTINCHSHDVVKKTQRNTYSGVHEVNALLRKVMFGLTIDSILQISTALLLSVQCQENVDEIKFLNVSVKFRAKKSEFSCENGK